MGLTAKLNEVYKDESLEIRFKVRALFVITSVVLCILPLGIVSSFFVSKAYGIGIVQLIMLLVFGAVLFMTLKGKFRIASSVSLGVVYLGMTALLFVFPFAHRSDAFRFSTFFLVVLSAVGLYGYSLRQLLLIAAGSFVSMFLQIFFMALPALPRGEVISGFISAGILLLFGLICIYLSMRNGQMAIKKADEAAAVSAGNLLHIQELLNSSRDGLTIGQDLCGAAEMSVDLITRTGERLSRMQEEVLQLREQALKTIDSHDKIGMSKEDVKNQMIHQTSAMTESSAAIEQITASIKSIKI